MVGKENIDNIIHLTGQPEDVLHSFRVLRKGVVFMSTYEEFMISLTTALLIVSVLTYTHKKWPSCPGKLTTIF